MRYRAIASTAAVAALLLGAACSGDGEDDAIVQGQAAGDKGASATTAGEDGSSTTAGGGGDGSSGAAPQDQDLDVEMRNPLGVTLRVSRLSFEGNDIFVDAQVINSSTYDITFHAGNGITDRLRLVDDAGAEYNFVEPEGQEGQAINVAQGETLDGTFAFRGPLSGEPEELSLVTNLYNEDVSGFDLNDESATSSYYPAFVVPFDLTWE